jgi:hypothetical protein
MHDGVVLHHVVVDDGRLAVNGRHPGRWEAMMVYVMAAEIAEGNEGEGADAEAEVETSPHTDAVIPPA